MTAFGFTGSQSGMSPSQQDWLLGMFGSRHSLHHGACVGSDATAHWLAMSLRMDVVVHPPEDRSRMMPLVSTTPMRILPPRPYLKRNRDIVDACDLLLATPDRVEHLRSGTWATVRYARKIGKPVLVCLPSGELTN